MFVAEMTNNCGISSWRTNSQIVSAQSKGSNWNTNYTRLEMMMPPFHHSPGIIYAPDTNEWVLTYVLSKDMDHETPPCDKCSAGYTGKKFYTF